MLEKTITFTDYNGVERTETFSFNLTEAELTEMELTVEGGFSGLVKRITDAKDVPSLIKIFKDLILRSYGVVSPDGRRFIKSDELKTDFSQTEAYSKLFMELATNDVAASDFINGIVPSNIAKKASELTANQQVLKEQADLLATANQH